MEINYLQVNKNNLDLFMPVLPDGLVLADNRVTIGAFDEDEGCLGAVSFSLVGFEYVIDWIYVDEQFRLRGIGRSLINTVIDIVMKTGDRYPITARFEYDDENSLYIFFLSLPDILTDFSHKRYYITSNDIRNITSLRKPSGQSTSTEPFFARSVNEQKRILAKLEYEETYTVADYDKWKETCEQDLC
ncbi:MAG: GNAT family N-acetyltransferase, partial [Butyrivibrio sp.]|nr:GNAT family N-acetyltransferase [Butyrivibrio sp.]